MQLTSGHSTRKHLSNLRQAEYLQRHHLPVALPESNGAAPVYFPTKAGAELLASRFDDERYLATITRPPRADRLSHWIELNNTRIAIVPADEFDEENLALRSSAEFMTYLTDAESRKSLQQIRESFGM